MKITSRPGLDAPPPRTTSLDLATERRAYEDRLARMLADPDKATPDALQSAFAGPTLEGISITDLDRADAAALLQERQSALGQTVADAREAGQPIPAAVEDLFDTLQGVSGKVGAAEPPPDGYEQGTTHEQLQEMKDLLAGRSDE